MSPRTRTLLIWLVLVGTLMGLTWAVRGDDEPIADESVLRADLAADQVATWAYDDGDVIATRADGSAYRVVLPEPAIYETLGTVPMATPDTSPWVSLLTLVLPLALLVAALVYFVRVRQKGVAANVLALRNHTARQLVPGAEKTRFTDVGGAVEAKERLADAVDWLKDPRRWQQAGARPPRGVLLEGPPGSGKTLLARAIAGEAGVPVFVAAGSEFVEMFVGIGAARVRDLFAAARKAAPAVIFIDELDAIGRRRGSGIGTGHDEREATLNQLLVCLDGFEPNERVIVVAATNRVDVLDKALLRPGRFDVHVTLPDPAEADRLEILRIHTRSKTLAADVSLEALAARTGHWSGAALEHLCNEAALAALRRSRNGGAAAIAARDVEVALATAEARGSGFDQLDAVLLDSASQLARPGGAAVARLELVDGAVLEGQVLWADAHFVKVRVGAEARIVPKRQVRALVALDGTAAAEAEEVVGDRWTGRPPDVA